MYKWAKSSAKLGNLITFLAPTKAYNLKGTGYLVDEGQTVLILESSEYDLTFLSHGEVLFCSPDSDFFVRYKEE